MTGISVATATAKLQLWLDAEEKVAAGQSKTIDGRSLTRADLGEIGRRIDYWNAKVQKLSRGGAIGIIRTGYHDG
jgi:hypothetical protein